MEKEKNINPVVCIPVHTSKLNKFEIISIKSHIKQLNKYDIFILIPKSKQKNASVFLFSGEIDASTKNQVVEGGMRKNNCTSATFVPVPPVSKRSPLCLRAE